MTKELIARGQATLTIQQDAYTFSLCPAEYIVPSTSDGKIVSAFTVVFLVTVVQGDEAVTAYTIGAVVKPEGFSSIVVDNKTKSIIFTVAANTTNLADHGTVDIPVIVGGMAYHLSFVWSKAKAGVAGRDANMLEWVKEWNTGKTQIGESTVITPKLFAGVKNADGIITGTAAGRYSVSCKTTAGSITTETIDGLCCFKDGYKTFCFDNGGQRAAGAR